MRRRPLSVALFLSLGVSWQSLARGDRVSADALRILQADVILSGRVSDITPRPFPNRGRVSLHIAAFKVLKGAIPKWTADTVEILGWVESEKADKLLFTPSQLHELGQKHLFLFATRSPQGDDKLYLQHPSENIRPYNAREAKALIAEIAHQATLVSEFAHAPYAQPDDTDRGIKSELDRLITASAKQSAYWLLSVRCSVVPALIRQMDDRRPYAGDELAVGTGPGAFEGVAHYEPKLVVDAVSIILGHLTNQSFGFIHNGGADEARQREVTKWRTWLALTGGRPTCY
jgi:hypothetical protein